MQLVNPLNLDVIEDVTGRYAPRHEVIRPDHVAALAADMRQHGWRGAPVVVHEDYSRAITGTHRMAAAEEAEIMAPGVDIEQLLEACGINLWERVAEMAPLCCDEVLIHLVNRELPDDVVTAYGLDIC